jgi:(p)ppGpp synthase/HD superfamily hydrolase
MNERNSDLDKAIQIATALHSGLFRKPHHGFAIPSIVHPMRVMEILWKWGFNKPTILIAAACHDLIEDCGLAYEYLRTQIGDEPAGVVLALTFIPPDGISNHERGQLKRKYLKGLATGGVYALVVKAADRICNVLDFTVSDPEYAIKYFHKADAIWEALEARREDIIAEFGAVAYHNLLRAQKTLGEFLESGVGAHPLA